MSTQITSTRKSTAAFVLATALLALPAVGCDSADAGPTGNSGNSGAASGKADEVEGSTGADDSAESSGGEAKSTSCKAAYINDVDPNAEIELSLDDSNQALVGRHEGFTVSLSFFNDTEFEAVVENEETHWGANARGLVASDVTAGVPGLSLALFEVNEETEEFVLSNVSVTCSTDPTYGGTAIGEVGGSASAKGSDGKEKSTSCKAAYINDVDPNADIELRFDDSNSAFVGRHEAFTISLSFFNDTEFEVAVENEETHWGANARGLVASDVTAGVPGLSLGLFEVNEETEEFVLSNVSVSCSTDPTYGGTPVHP